MKNKKRSIEKFFSFSLFIKIHCTIFYFTFVAAAPTFSHSLSVVGQQKKYCKVFFSVLDFIIFSWVEDKKDYDDDEVSLTDQLYKFD